jgi:uncharacterized protein YjbI with pentapeptide repeats
MSADTLIEIRQFSAVGSVFDSLKVNDFSFAIFKDESVSFKNTEFLHGKTSFQGAIFEEGSANFSHCIFRNGNLDFSQADLVAGGIIFNGSEFGEGIKDFHYTRFGDKDVSFVAVMFGDGHVSFINTSFGDGDVSFSRAEFGKGDVDFHFTHFHNGNISFERTLFGSGNLDFHMIEFDNCKLTFNRSEFGDGDLNFEACVMKEGKMQFKRTLFGNGNVNFENMVMPNSDLLFDKSIFGYGNVSFYKSEFNNISFKSCQINSYLDLRIARSIYLDLTDTIVRDVVDMTPYDFKINIDSLDIAGMRLLGQINVDWKENALKQIIFIKNSDNRKLADQFRILKQNFNKIGRYDDEDLAYIEFKRCEAKAILEESIKEKKGKAFLHYPLYWFKLWVFDRMGLFATSPLRVLLSVLVTFLALAIIQYILPFFFETGINCISADASEITRFLDTMYYSGITYLTVGYGDCSPTGVLKFVANLEAFIGVFMMSYFTVAFARKVLR